MKFEATYVVRKKIFASKKQTKKRNYTKLKSAEFPNVPPPSDVATRWNSSEQFLSASSSSLSWNPQTPLTRVSHSLHTNLCDSVNMAGIRLPPEDSDVSQAARQVAAVDLISDDDRSIAADSWSIKSDYGSTLDDEQRQADAAEALSSAAYRAASDYR